jgi:SAM-dependent methyltransferase
VDIDREILDRARASYPESEFLELDGAALPFPDEEFDAVVLSEVIEHVGDDKKASTMSEAMRVLRIGGRLILTAPHSGIFSFADPLDVKRRYPILYRAYQRRTKRQPLTPAEIGHKHVTLAELHRLLRGDAELELVEYSGPAAPIGDFLLALCLVLPRIPSAIVWRVGGFQSWAAGLPAPRLLASDIRLRARKTR